MRGLPPQPHHMVEQAGLLVATDGGQGVLKPGVTSILNRQNLTQHQGVHAFDARHRHRRNLVQGPGFEADADRVPRHQKPENLTPSVRQGLLPASPTADDQTRRRRLPLAGELGAGGDGLTIEAELADQAALILGQGGDGAQHPQSRDIGRGAQGSTQGGARRRRRA
ncbi:hypothetical protein D3C86_1716230 [compost metagenome]